MSLCVCMCMHACVCVISLPSRHLQIHETPNCYCLLLVSLCIFYVCLFIAYQYCCLSVHSSLLFLSTCFFMNMIMSYQPVWGGFVGWGKPLTQVDHKQHKFFFVWVLVLFFIWNIQENFSYNKLCYNKNYKSKVLCKISQAEVSPKH